MLHNVTWGQYITGVAVLMLLYYLTIILLYYRDEATQFIRRGPTPNSPDRNTNTGSTVDKDEISGGLESVVADLGGILKEAGKEVSKQALLEQLQRRLTNYAGLRHPAFRHAINNYIISHAAATNGHTFSEQELNRYWEALPT